MCGYFQNTCPHLPPLVTRRGAPSNCLCLCVRLSLSLSLIVCVFSPSDSLCFLARILRNPWSSMCAGLFLVLRYSYLQLVFGVACLYEVVLTVLDYEMKVVCLSFTCFGGALQFSSCINIGFVSLSFHPC
jgi:hypothetical protein